MASINVKHLLLHSQIATEYGVRIALLNNRVVQYKVVRHASEQESHLVHKGRSEMVVVAGRRSTYLDKSQYSEDTRPTIWKARYGNEDVSVDKLDPNRATSQVSLIEVLRYSIGKGRQDQTGLPRVRCLQHWE